MRIAGIDGCKGGWIAVCADAGNLASAGAQFVTRVDDLFTRFAVDFAVVDIPIGFSSGPAGRDVEKAMRGCLKGKASSVFNTPCRAALATSSYPEASEVNFQQIGVGLSKQTWAIFPKMREMDESVISLGQHRLREGHPEVSFAILAGSPVLSRKRKLDGFAERHALLQDLGLPIEMLLAQTKTWPCQRDDLLDAAVLLWTADRFQSNQHQTLPPIPSRDTAGLEMSVIA